MNKDDLQKTSNIKYKLISELYQELSKNKLVMNELNKYLEKKLNK